MNKLIPSYLLDFKTNLKLLAFVGLFSVLFIVIYTPFEHSVWFRSNAHNYGLQFTYSIIVLAGGLSILLAARGLLHLVSRRFSISYVQYAFWIIGEILLVTIAYSVFNKFVLQDSRSILDIFRRAILFIPTILFIPYLISYLYFALKEKDIKLSNLLTHANNTEKEEAIPQNPNGIINFHDEKGDLKLSLRQDSIFFIESADNYVKIYYEKNGKPMRHILRNTLKNMETTLRPYGFARCHRSYVVNLPKIQIIRKEHEGFFIDFASEEIQEIPISKTYAPEITQLFSH